MSLMSLNVVKEFLQELADIQSTNKVEVCEQELTKLIDFASSKGKSILSLDRKDLMAYLRLLRAETRENSTVNQTLTLLRNFYQFLIDKNYLQHNPTTNLTNPKAWQTMPKFLNKVEIDKLFAQPDCKSDVGVRDLAMLQLLYVTGIRVSELITIKLADLNLSQSTLTYLGKNNKERDIALGKAEIALNEYLPARKRLLREKQSDLLFTNNYGEEMTRQQFWRIIVEYGESAGLGHITPHMLRHTFATHLLEQGADNASVAMLDSNEGSKKEYTHIADDRLKSVYEKFHPRSR